MEMIMSEMKQSSSKDGCGYLHISLRGVMGWVGGIGA